MAGKHTKEGLRIKDLLAKIDELEEIIKRKDKEIEEIKMSVADVFEEIRNLNEGNQGSDSSPIRRRISEICTDTRYELLIDIIDKYTQEHKIIKLPMTAQSNR